MSTTHTLQKLPKLFLSLLLSITVVFGIISIPTSAQKIGVKPFNENGQSRGIFRYIVNAGETINDAVLVVNASDFEGGAIVKARDAETDTSGNIAFIADDIANTRSGNWIKLAEEKVVVPAQKALKIPFVLTIPQGTAAGEYAAGIVVSPTADTSDGGVGVQVRSGTTVYITVRGDLKIDNQVSEFSIVNPKQEGFEQELDSRGFIKSDNMVVKFKGINAGNVYSQMDLVINIEAGNGDKKEIKLKRTLNLNSSYQYYYINTGMAYTPGTTKATMQFTSSAYNLTGGDSVDIKKTPTSDGTLDYSFSLTADDITSFNTIRDRLLARRTAETKPAGDTAGNPNKPQDFVVKEVEKPADVKTEDKKSDNNVLIGSLIGLIVILVAAFVGYILYSKRKDKEESDKKATVDSTTPKMETKETATAKKAKK